MKLKIYRTYKGILIKFIQTFIRFKTFGRKENSLIKILKKISASNKHGRLGMFFHRYFWLKQNWFLMVSFNSSLLHWIAFIFTMKFFSRSIFYLPQTNVNVCIILNSMSRKKRNLNQQFSIQIMKQKSKKKM